MPYNIFLRQKRSAHKKSMERSQRNNCQKKKKKEHEVPINQRKRRKILKLKKEMEKKASAVGEKIKNPKKELFI